jgi:hypothetical protein
MLDTIILNESDVTRLATSLTTIINALPSHQKHLSILCLNKLLEDFKNSTGNEQIKDFFLLLHLVTTLSGNEDHEVFKKVTKKFLKNNHIQRADKNQQGLIRFTKFLGEFWFECDSIDDALSNALSLEEEDIQNLDSIDINTWNQVKKEVIQRLEKAYIEERALNTPLQRKKLLLILFLLGIGIALNVIAAASILLKCHGVASFLTGSSLALASSPAALALLITTLSIAALGIVAFIVLAAAYHRQKTNAYTNPNDLKQGEYQLLAQQESDIKPAASANLKPSVFQTLFPCLYKRKTATEAALLSGDTPGLKQAAQS